MNTSTESRRLLIIAPPGSYRLAPYLKAAIRFNLTPLIASTSQHSILPRSVEGIHIDLSQPEQALQTLLELAQRCAQQHKPFAGVLGTDDATVELASEVAARLKLPHNPASATQLTRRKDLARTALQQAGLNIPWHTRIAIADDISLHGELNFPLVIKPLNLSASRGVIRVNNRAELAQAIDKIIPIIQHSEDQTARDFLLIEQYIDGTEIAVEAILHDNKLITLAVFDKPDPLQGPYFEETYYITPSRQKAQILQACEQQILGSCQAIGLTTGPLHAELRIDKHDKPWILEVAARTIGGDCGKSLKPSADFNLEELVISYAINQPLIPEPQTNSSGVLMIPVPKAGILKRTEGLTAAQKIPFITSISIDITPGNEVECLPESSSYLGFIFAEAETPEQTEEALRAAHNELSFVINPVWKIQ
ncbi:MAG: ATP-grasp domain-containing protein [Gammaproteobacteria bacterium]|nr:ATP-grasp domain-containing protein [Gammaproteobacteria bacterium]